MVLGGAQFVSGTHMPEGVCLRKEVNNESFGVAIEGSKTDSEGSLGADAGANTLDASGDRASRALVAFRV